MATLFYSYGLIFSIIENPPKRKKFESSNRRWVICLYCNRELNSDNELYHTTPFHAGQVLKFKDVYEKSQKQLFCATEAMAGKKSHLEPKIFMSKRKAFIKNPLIQHSRYLLQQRLKIFQIKCTGRLGAF